MILPVLLWCAAGGTYDAWFEVNQTLMTFWKQLESEARILLRK